MRAWKNFSSVGRWLPTIVETSMAWLATCGLWWAMSAVTHLLVICTLLLFLGTRRWPQSEAEVTFVTAISPIVDPSETLQSLSVSLAPTDDDKTATELDLAPVEILDAAADAVNLDEPIGQGGDDDMRSGSDFGPSSRGIDRDALGPIVNGPGPGGSRTGSAVKGGGSGDGGIGGSLRGRQNVVSSICGITGPTEAAVKRALAWIARHQSGYGSWSLGDYRERCRDATCAGDASFTSDAAATGLALLPFLAAGHTHHGKGPYRENVQGGLRWLVAHQKPDGDLSDGSAQPMYAHALATIAVCEALAMTYDRELIEPAQRAIDYIQRAQHTQSGGWRYKPGEVGDTSVVGWQVMALKSGQMANLKVDQRALVGARKWLKSTAQGDGGLFSYEPGGGPTSPITAVGLLSTQYLGAQRDDAGLKQGVAHLLDHLPSETDRNIYYWYYATQVMHNLPGPEWDRWNRRMRAVLVDSQSKTAGLCSHGSWSPSEPVADAWGSQGGRLMVTCMSCLTLEVYYRYLPLYRLDKR